MRKFIKGLLIGFCCLCMNIQAQESGQCGDNAYWIYEESTKILTISGEGDMWAMYPSETNQPWYHFRESIEKIIVEEGIISLGHDVFRELSKLNEVKLPESLTRIGPGAFQMCGELRLLTIPSNVNSIDGFFIGETNIENLICLAVEPPTCGLAWGMGTFTNVDVENIKVQVPFGSAEKYRKADQWSEIKNIINGIDISAMCGNDAFWEFVDSAKTLRIWGTGRIWDMPSDSRQPWLNIRHDFTNVLVEEGITHSGQAFLFSASNADNVYLPSTLKEVGGEAFSGTLGLKRLILPENVETLTNAAFYGTVLEVLYCLNKIPPKTATEGWYSSWHEVDTSNITLYVRSESVDAYKADPGWSGFKILPLNIPNKIERVKGISLPEKITGRIGDEIRLTEYLKPASAAVKHLYIDCANSNVAKPLQDGSVVLVGNVGEETEIYVRTVDGGYTSKSIIRILNNNVNLKSLELNFDIEPLFNKDITDYHATISGDVYEALITAITEDSCATVKYNNQLLKDGDNEITISVTAEDGSVKDYNIHVYRISKEARLKTLKVSNGTLSPYFIPDIKKYLWKASKNHQQLSIWPETVSEKASMEGEKELTFTGDTTFIIQIKSEDEKHIERYEITLKLYNNDATLKNLEVEDFKFEKEFKSEITNYHVRIPSDVDGLWVEAEANDPNARLTGSLGWRFITGSETTFVIDVMAEDRETHKYYYIYVHREAVNTSIEQTMRLCDETVRIYTVDGRYLGTTERKDKKIIIPDWLGHGVFIAKGSKYREKFTN